jgi:hypothetical protein
VSTNPPESHRGDGAADVEFGGGDESCLVAGKKRDPGGHVLDPAVPLEQLKFFGLA